MLADFRRTRPYVHRDEVIDQLARTTRELGARDFCAPAGDPPLAGGRLFAIILAADDDWPQEWYARLCFERVGGLCEFTRNPAEPQ
jgi:hypothetical protein